MAGKDTLPAFPPPTRSQEEMIAVSAELLHKENTTLKIENDELKVKLLGMQAVIDEQGAAIDILLAVNER